MSRIAVVTGTSRGLGKELVNLLHENNYNIITGERTINTHNNLKNVKSFHLDLNNQTSITNFINHIITLVPHIDILINNAATCPSSTSNNNKKVILQVNVLSLIHITTSLIPLLVNKGKVINISSGDGELLYFKDDIKYELDNIGETCISIHAMMNRLNRFIEEDEDWVVYGGQKIYKISKALINVFTRVATRVYHNIYFVAVCPGDVETEMMDVGCKDALSAKEAARRIWPIIHVDVSNEKWKWNGKFVRYGTQIPW